MARAKKLPAGVRIQDIFKTVAKECAAQVKGLPKGERVQAYRKCIGERMKAELARYRA
jgi:hypothetical protein